MDEMVKEGTVIMFCADVSGSETVTDAVLNKNGSVTITICMLASVGVKDSEAILTLSTESAKQVINELIILFPDLKDGTP